MANEVKLVKPAVKEEPVLTHTALGIHRLPNGEYAVARILYNPVANVASIVEVLIKGERAVAVEQFKISTSREIFSRDSL